jgi:uncharacterized membrane protein
VKNLGGWLVILNMTISVIMYYPLFKRILTRKSTADFSIATQAAIVFLQLSSLVAAASAHAWYLFSYYILGLILTSLTLVLIVRYRAGPRLAPPAAPSSPYSDKSPGAAAHTR